MVPCVPLCPLPAQSRHFGQSVELGQLCIDSEDPRLSLPLWEGQSVLLGNRAPAEMSL